MNPGLDFLEMFCDVNKSITQYSGNIDLLFLG